MATEVAELVTGVAQSLLPAIPNRACLRGSPRAPIDAGLANASDTSYIYEVLDSHPSFRSHSRNRALWDERSPLNHYGLGVISRSVAGG